MMGIGSWCQTNKCFRVVDENIIVMMDDTSSLDKMVSAVRDMLLSSPDVLQKSDVMNLRTKYKGHLKIFEPQFVLDGWSNFGAKFRVRAYFKAGLSGDKFMAQKSNLLLAINTMINEFGGKVGFSGAMPNPVARAMQGRQPMLPQESFRESAAWRQVVSAEAAAAEAAVAGAAADSAVAR